MRMLAANVEAIVDRTLPRRLEPGDVVAILSNGGFDGIYEKLPARLAGPASSSRHSSKAVACRWHRVTYQVRGLILYSDLDGAGAARGAGRLSLDADHSRDPVLFRVGFWIARAGLPFGGRAGRGQGIGAIPTWGIDRDGEPLLKSGSARAVPAAAGPSGDLSEGLADEDSCAGLCACGWPDLFLCSATAAWRARRRQR